MLTFNASQLNRFIKNLKNWAHNGVDKDLERGADYVVNKYKSQIKAGKAGDNTSMKPVKDVTMDMPVRFASDPTLRREVNASRNPLVAYGRAVNSIGKNKKGANIEIGPQTFHGKIVFADNAFPRKNSRQKTTKPVRDPLIVSDVQLDIIEKEIMKGIDKVLRK